MRSPRSSLGKEAVYLSAKVMIASWWHPWVLAPSIPPVEHGLMGQMPIVLGNSQARGHAESRTRVTDMGKHVIRDRVRLHMHLSCKIGFIGLILLALGGCVVQPPKSAPAHLPAELLGEWVDADFEVIDRDSRRQTSGMAIWLLADGRGVWCAGGEIGSPCSARYNSSMRMLTLKNIPFRGEPGEEVTSYQLLYSPGTRMLTLVDVHPRPDGDLPKDYRTMKLHRRQIRVPEFVVKDLGR
jgi:hypothetical protein